MKKIAIISPGVLPVPATHGGAIETLMEFIAKENERIHHKDLTVFSVNGGQFIDTSKYKYTNFIFINEQSFLYKIKRIVRGILSKISKNINKQYISEVKKIIKKNKMDFDSVVIENKPQYVLAINKLFPGKVILHMHNDFIHSNLNNVQQILNCCKKILTVSGFIKNQILQVKDVEDKIHVVYNGININNFIESNQKKNKDFCYTYVGRIVEEKGVNEILTSYEKLSKKYSDIKLIIVGSPKFKGTKDNDLMKKIKELSLKFKDKILITGFVSYENIPNYYMNSDVMLVPSKCNEALATSVIEAIASGALLITTNDGGIPEMVDSSCAYICDKNNLLKDLEKNMEKAYLNREFNEELKKNIKKRREFYSKERFVTDFFNEID